MIKRFFFSMAAKLFSPTCYNRANSKYHLEKRGTVMNRWSDERLGISCSCLAPSLLAGGNADRERETLFPLSPCLCLRYSVVGNLMVWFITSRRRILRIFPSGWRWGRSSRRRRRSRRRRDDGGIISLLFLHLCVCGRDYKSSVCPPNTQPARRNSALSQSPPATGATRQN